MAATEFFGGGSKDVASKPAPASGGSEKVEAAQDVIDAITDGDATALSLALERHYEVCQGADHEDEVPHGKD